MIKKEINIHKSIYAATPYNPDYIEVASHNFEIMISPSLFWETLLVTLSGAINKYSKRRKTHKKQELVQLENSIRQLDLKVSMGQASEQEIVQLAELNTQLVDSRKETLKSAYIRSRADWLEYGEKLFFLNMGKNFFF